MVHLKEFTGHRLESILETINHHIPDSSKIINIVEHREIYEEFDNQSILWTLRVYYRL